MKEKKSFFVSKKNWLDGFGEAIEEKKETSDRQEISIKVTFLVNNFGFCG